MKVDNELISKISTLAKLKFEKKDLEKIKADLEKIIHFIGKLSEVNTENVEPLVFMNKETNILREDDVEEVLAQDKALKNAPDKDSYYFRVPKVLKK
tara:strand:- start:96 stop:386 length:291 start_codon:yes stop_codon:yes gene_type:complete